MRTQDLGNLFTSNVFPLVCLLNMISKIKVVFTNGWRSSQVLAGGLDLGGGSGEEDLKRLLPEL